MCIVDHLLTLHALLLTALTRTSSFSLMVKLLIFLPFISTGIRNSMSVERVIYIYFTLSSFVVFGRTLDVEVLFVDTVMFRRHLLHFVHRYLEAVRHSVHDTFRFQLTCEFIYKSFAAPIYTHHHGAHEWTRLIFFYWRNSLHFLLCRSIRGKWRDFYSRTGFEWVVEWHYTWAHTYALHAH